MYALANRIEPDDLRSWRRSCSSRCSKAATPRLRNFTTCTARRTAPRTRERMPCGRRSAAPRPTAGIGLTFLPTLYQSSDFGGQALKPSRRDSRSRPDAFLRAVEERIGAERRSGSSARPRTQLHRRGIPQSSRGAAREPAGAPLAAARNRRRDARAHPCGGTSAARCRPVSATTGRRPVELLLDTGLLTRHWCLVHATHATARRLAGIAASRRQRLRFYQHRGQPRRRVLRHGRVFSTRADDSAWARTASPA